MKTRLTIMAILFVIIGFMSIATLSGETMPEPASNYHEANAGSEENPFLIANLANLRWLSENSRLWQENYHFLQTADIDATETENWWPGLGFNPIGGYFYVAEYPFTGVYDGNGFAISNIYVKNYPGVVPTTNITSALFGFTENATIKNVRLENFVANYINFPFINSFGSIVGIAINTTILNCEVTGNIFLYHEFDVQFPTRIGGIAGILDNSILENSFFYGNIFSRLGNEAWGGLVGEMINSTLTYCYSASNAEFDYMSGLVGRVAQNSDENMLSTISNNFWDIETTATLEAFNEIADTNAIIENNFGKSTLEMKLASTYIENGWNFEDIWMINPRLNDGYPFLRNTLKESVFFSPGELITSVEDAAINLSWSEPFPAVNNAFVGFRIYRNDEPLIGLLPTNTLFYADTDIILHTEYTYYVTAVYENPDGESAPSNKVTVLIGEMLPPTDFAGIAENATVILNWSAPKSNPTGYDVYRDDLLLTDVHIAELTFTEYDVPDGIYTYSVCAVYITGKSELVSQEIKVNTVSNTDENVISFQQSMVYPNPVQIGDVTIKWANPPLSPLTKGGNMESPLAKMGNMGITLTNGSNMEISIYNVRGQIVKRSRDFQIKDGENVFVWDRKDENNQDVASGLYLYQIQYSNNSVYHRPVASKGEESSMSITGRFLILK